MTKTVLVVDDDPTQRRLIQAVLEREGFAVAHAEGGAPAIDRMIAGGAADVVLLDLNMPGMSGLDLQKCLKERGVELPVIFLSGRADVPKAVHAVKEGAVDFIEKPFDYKRVVELIGDCLRRDAATREERERRREIERRLAQLTQREREVLEEVVAGRLNREIAEKLAISVKTVEAHRAKIMEKIEVSSVAELVQATVAARGRT